MVDLSLIGHHLPPIYPNPGPSDILGAIDGTGDSDINNYRKDMSHSFVHQIFDFWKGTAAGSGNSIYVDGPSYFDTIRPVEDAVNEVYKFVRERLLQQLAPVQRKLTDSGTSYTMRGPPKSPLSVLFLSGVAGRQRFDVTDGPEIRRFLQTTRPPRIFLLGYSRGAAGVVSVAHKLKERSIPVHCLLIFDLVDRSRQIDWADMRIGLVAPRSIPDNVHFCYHAKRDPAMSSRVNFGPGVTNVENRGKTIFWERSYPCTHGGMGGVPWGKDDPNITLSNTSFDDQIKRDQQEMVMRSMPHLERVQMPQPSNTDLSKDQKFIQESYTLAPTNVRVGDDAAVSQLVGFSMVDNLNNALKSPGSSYWEVVPP